MRWTPGTVKTPCKALAKHREHHCHNGPHASGNALAGRNACQYKLCGSILQGCLVPWVAHQLEQAQNHQRAAQMPAEYHPQQPNVALAPGCCRCRCLQYIQVVSLLLGQWTAIKQLPDKPVKCQPAQTNTMWTACACHARSQSAGLNKSIDSKIRPLEQHINILLTVQLDLLYISGDGRIPHTHEQYRSVVISSEPTRLKSYLRYASSHQVMLAAPRSYLLTMQ